jgi:hypothetical protein
MDDTIKPYKDASLGGDQTVTRERHWVHPLHSESQTPLHVMAALDVLHVPLCNLNIVQHSSDHCKHLSLFTPAAIEQTPEWRMPISDERLPSSVQRLIFLLKQLAGKLKQAKACLTSKLPMTKSKIFYHFNQVQATLGKSGNETKA